MMRAAACLALLVAVACGDPPALPPTPQKPGERQIQVRPAEALLQPGETLPFSVVPSAAQVTWSVQEAGGGTITASGIYTAPGRSGVFHVVATVVGTTVTGSATVTVDSGVRITAPDPQQAAACEPYRLQATVTGAANTTVIFAAPMECGTIGADGVTFTPARVSGTCTIDATAAADPAQFVRFTLNVAAERILSVGIAPPSATTPAGGSVNFSATVATTCGTFPATAVQ